MESLLSVYCARSWIVSTWWATRAHPLTSPPLIAETIDVGLLKRPIVYLRLHGFPNQPYLYGDRWITALSTAQVRAHDFKGSLVFLEGCFGIEFGSAFMLSGAVAVVGSTQPTWGRRWHLGPSSKVGKTWLREIKRGSDVQTALLAAIYNVPKPFSEGWETLGDRGAKLNHV